MSKAQRRLTAADRLAARQELVENEERRMALCALLRNPLLTSEKKTADSFRLVRRHSPWLKKWLLRWPNWALVMTADVARLRKYPSLKKDTTRGLIDKSSSSERSTFTRRRYGLLCLVLAMLESEQRQTTIQQIARKTASFVRVNSEFGDLDYSFDPRELAHRRDLVAVMRFLQRKQVLVRADGDDKSYVHSDGDCLYRIERTTLAMLLCSARGASTIDNSNLNDFILALNEVETPEFDEAQNRQLQNALVRRLLDDPIMYFDELTPREYQYFNDQGERLTKELHRVTGMFVERRVEGVAMLDLDGDWTDLGLPESGTRGHATLLLAEWFGDRLRSEETPSVLDSPEATTASATSVPMADVKRYLTQLAQANEKRWRKNANTPEGIRQILADSLSLLESLALIEINDDKVLPRPAIARYCLAAPTVPRKATV